MTDNKKVSKKNDNDQVKESILSDRLDFCKSDLPGVVETSSLGEIKKPKKSD